MGRSKLQRSRLSIRLLCCNFHSLHFPTSCTLKYINSTWRLSLRTRTEKKSQKWDWKDMSKNKKTKGLFTIEGNEKRGRREGDYNRTELKGVSSPWQHLCGCYLAKEMRPQTPTPISGNPTLQLLCLPSLFKYWKVLKLFIHPVFSHFILLSKIERFSFVKSEKWRKREGKRGWGETKLTINRVRRRGSSFLY